MTTDNPGTPSGVPGPSRAHRIESMVFVSILLVASIGVLWFAGTIREPIGSASAIGARAIPYAVGGLMLLSSLGILVGQLRGNYGEAEDGEDVDANAKPSWGTVAIVGLSFLSLVITIPHLGWPLAITILFAGAAIALGAKRWWMAIIVGFVIGLVTQLAFGTWLGLSLPATGTLTNWIGI